MSCSPEPWRYQQQPSPRAAAAGWTGLCAARHLRSLRMQQGASRIEPKTCGTARELQRGELQRDRPPRLVRCWLTASLSSLRNGCAVPKNAAVRATRRRRGSRPAQPQPARIAASRAALIERRLRPGCATDPRERARQDVCVRITVGFCRGSATRGRTGGRSGGAQEVSPSAPRDRSRA